jgi:glycine/D-amino acid oxidase-like deaminating enzyme
LAPTIDRIQTDSELPKKTDVLVIGGGIIGVTTAYFLAERGVDVTLCEKGYIAGEQSSRNWGWCRKMGRDPAELPLAIESLKLWEGMNERIGGETGYRRAGILYVCDTAKDLANYEQWVEHAKLYQLDSRLLTAAEVRERLPGATREFVGGLYTASDGRAEPFKAVAAIAQAARAKGAKILQNCAVRGVETKGGRVATAVTEKGRIDCNTAVLAGGAWSRLFCGNQGFDFPQLKVLGSVMRTAPLDGPPTFAVGGSDFAFRRRLDGGYTLAQRGANISEIVPDSFRLFFDFLPALKAQWHELRLRVGKRFVDELRMPRKWSLDGVSPFEQVRVLDPDPAAPVLKEAEDNLTQAVPAFKNMQIVERWAGLVDATPDAVPVIGPVAAVPGLFLSTGYSGHGFGIGPGAGRLTADMVMGRDPVVDPSPFRFERFAKRNGKAAAAPVGPTLTDASHP